MASKTEYILRSRDVAHILDCSPDEVIELAQSKKLKATKEGRLWKYRAADVLAYKKNKNKRA
jgi:excisionase family DNA binding protein